MSVQSYVVLQPDCGATKFSFLWPGAIEHFPIDGARGICVKRNVEGVLSRIILCCRGFYRVHCARNKLVSPSLTCVLLHIDDKLAEVGPTAPVPLVLCNLRIQTIVNFWLSLAGKQLWIKLAHAKSITKHVADDEASLRRSHYLRLTRRLG
ncbi:hypothetical protein PGTUg99_008952 [Puccinia graminis f. sp. tritici]|uniref:Uncharacterized protein n=1 Tax=Puccinia graminis f. sp. tritici TaxID=56615 RepID=A0A5B0RPD2_PUCGR|nr:hypothetical protein PGTUg99_008952 [Puccinia graminis f. sp. tritici]